MQIYIDGEFYSKEDAKISVFDHGLLYGDGVFEGIRIYKAGYSSSTPTSTGCTPRRRSSPSRSPCRGTIWSRP